MLYPGGGGLSTQFKGTFKACIWTVQGKWKDAGVKMSGVYHALSDKGEVKPRTF